jgi:hypothetical protein
MQETKDRANQIKHDAEAHLSSEQIQTLKAGISDRSLEELVDAIAVK